MNNQHPIDQIETYVTGGLLGEERAAFEAHVAECESCRAALERARSADASVAALFADIAPSAGFEDRLIQGLDRGGLSLRRIHPWVRRAAVGIAASLLLGGIGFAGTVAMDGKSPLLAFANASSRRVKASANARQIGLAMGMYGNVGAPFSVKAWAAPVRDVPVSAAADGKPGADKATNGVTWAYGLGNQATGGKDSLKYDQNGAVEKKAEATKAGLSYYSEKPTDVSRSLAEGITTPAANQPAAAYFRVNDLARPNAALAINDKLQPESEALQKTSPGATGMGIRGPELATAARDLGAQKAGDGAPVQQLSRNDNSILSLGANVKPAEPASPAAPGSHGAPASGDAATKFQPGATQTENGPAKTATGAASAPAPANGGRKIIRSGEMEFEVDNFDTASNTIAKVVVEEGGFVSTTNSDKLPNGKVKGSIILRVPPEHLDTLVLKLRGIGDLRTQRIGAQDITKQYTDLQSALTAAQAMYDRLIDIVKTGKGQVKDLLEAEKQLGVWREKLEQLKGEINYYNNMVALSTLTVTLFERDIRTPAYASETETVNMNFETQKVEEAYTKVREAIEQAKGRIVSSQLKQFDAGQFGGTISAQLPPDAAQGVINRIRQLDGRVTHFDRQKNQTTSNGNSPVNQRAADPLKVKREDVTLNISLYNLANVAPRQTTTLTLVAQNVEEAYRALIEQTRSAGGKVVTSQLTRPQPDQMTGIINLTVPTDKANVLMGALRGAGEVLRTDTAEAPDSQNVTESKRGFNVTVASLSAFRARESQDVRLAASNVPEAFDSVLNAVRAKGGRILTSELSQQDVRNASGKLEFEIAREAVGAIDQAMGKGEVISRSVARSTDTQNTVDSKVHMMLQVNSAQTLPPRESSSLGIEASDVQKAMDDFVAAALAAGGRQVDSPALSQSEGAQTTATIVVDVPMAQMQSLIARADGMGTRKSRSTSIDANAPEGKLARARLQVTFATPAALASNDEGVWAGVRRGLGTSLRGLSISIMLIIIGLCVVLPWIVIIWGGSRAVKYFRRRPVVTTAP